MAYRKYIAARVLGAGLSFVLPVTPAAKPPKPVDELEARVEALEAEVAELKARPGPVQVLANGESIGTYLDTERGVAFWGRSKTGYLFKAETRTTDTQNLAAGELAYEFHWYGLPDCEGPAVVGGSIIVDYVFQTPDPTDATRYYYLPKNASPTEFDVQSRRTSPAICGNTGGTVLGYIPVPNDPTITGVPNEPFTPPITLGQ